MDSNHWQKDFSVRYDSLRENISGLKPWNRRLLFFLPPLLVFSWVVFFFNPLNAAAGVIDTPLDAASPSVFVPPPIEIATPAAPSPASVSASTPEPVSEPSQPSIAPPSPLVVEHKSEILNYNKTKVALLIEDRPLGQLAPLTLHMINVVPPDWTFRFYGSKESINHLNHSLPIQMWERLGKLTMELVPSNLTLHGQQELSKTFTNLWFYETLLAPAEYLLVFQTDSIMCANSGMNLNDWLHYDWVGAPWVKNAQSGGNGGLSLRRVKPIIELLKRESRVDGDPQLEDLWLCNRLAQMEGVHMANGSTEAHFSVEAIWEEKPMGYHTGWSGARLPPDVWGEPEKRKKIYDYCPEMKMTISMKLEREGCDGKIKRDEMDVWSEIAAF
ncbi:hypothetical protein DRE_03319 [Drechslerella stenobrocha 248]|uniref:DUF5672 domain-containing protein n=1 Tax=Drechslerella stenobrocha 248 TaxID=1043628 RepID=W7IDY4_9PEZI|nr:hypothetical protein DRE_03319 [Drechslerella stenobrocha 248]